jgi:hypothetical protein
MWLAACGSGDEGRRPGEIAGAEGKPSASPTPSGDGVKRPVIRLPKHLKLIFEDMETGDAKKDALLRDARERNRATMAAVAVGEPRLRAVSFYNTGQAEVDTVAWISRFADRGDVLTGSFRYYNHRVTLNDDGSGSVAYCIDETGAAAKNLKTRKVTEDSKGKSAYVLQNERFQRTEQGVWQAVSGISEAGDGSCLP